MTIPFGPQLIGQTEKTLNALLVSTLAGRLTEPQWVTLRVAHQYEQQISGEADLVHEVADRARFADSAVLVADLTTAGLLHDGRPTPEGRALFDELFARVTENAAPIWGGLSDDDVAAATRVLNEVLNRARAAAV